jgi:hypothetical protein
MVVAFAPGLYMGGHIPTLIRGHDSGPVLIEWINTTCGRVGCLSSVVSCKKTIT